MTPAVLIQTKLCPGADGQDLIPRRPLLDRLGRRLRQGVRLVQLQAPTGSGKSSLVCLHFQSRKERPAWYSLDAGDRDIRQFLAYLVQAFQTAYPGSCPQVSARLAPLLEIEDWATVAALLINDLSAYPQPVSLVLDDYHLVADQPAVKGLMEFFVRHAPAHCTLYVTTRSETGLPVGSLRGKAAVLELRPDDFRFTPEETQQLFDQMWGCQLEADLARLLVERTEGWVTGLQLVAQATCSQSDEERRAYIESLGGGGDFVYDYLASEVFDLQSQDLQSFLQATSVVERFNPSLAEALAPETNPMRALETLERTRLFLIPLDREGQWFRYHHLFADFLRRRLELHTEPANVRSLHIRAAEWYRLQNEVGPAISHFLKSQQWDEAARLLAASGGSLLFEGQAAQVQGWLRDIPADVWAEHPGLLLLRGELHDLRGDWMLAVEDYQRARDAYRARNDDEHQGQVLEKLSLCLTKYGETNRLLEACQDGLRDCRDPATTSMLRTWFGSALVMSGEWERGYESILQAHAQAHRCGDPRALSWAYMAYAFVYHYPQGNFDDALAVLNEGISLFRRLNVPPVVFQLVMNKAMVLITKGAVTPALELIEESFKEAEAAGLHWLSTGLTSLRAWAHLEAGHLEAAESALESLAQAHIPAQMKPSVHRNRMLVYLATGSTRRALLTRDEMNRSLEQLGRGFYGLECTLSEAYLNFRLGELSQAVTLLDALLATCRKAKARFFEMRTLALRALVAEHEGEGGRDYLVRAHELTREHGFDAYWELDPWSLKEELESIETLPVRPTPSPPQWLLAPAPSDLELEIRTFGRLCIRSHGRELPLGESLRPLSERILKYLLTWANRPVSVDVICEEFWPESPPDKARHRLAQCISQVRKLLGSEVVERQRLAGYQLRLDGPIFCDVLRFGELIKVARSLVRCGRDAEAFELYRMAVELQAAEFLEDEPYEDWAIRRRVELRGLRDEALEFMGDYCREHGNFTDALPCYKTILGGDALSETIFRKLLQCYEGLGDRQGALLEFDEFRRRLVQTTGLDLQPGTQQMLASIFAVN